MINENFLDIFKKIPTHNPFGEKITVVGATKTVNKEDILTALNLGLTDIGENRVQELCDKFPYPPCNLHFIGHLQTNKVKYIIDKVWLIQSCDSIKLAQKIAELARRNGKIQDVLLEVNVGKEEQKYGLLPEEVLDAYRQISLLEGVRVKGLMTVLPKFSQTPDELPTNTAAEGENSPINRSNDGNILSRDKIIALCLQMRELYDKLKSENDQIEYLSMGMSADYKIAIDCGSNMLRIGSLLFGKRNYNKE